LRAIERENIPTFVSWFNDPEVRQYLLIYEPMSKAKEERWFERQLDSDDFLFAIEALVEEEWMHIGNVGLDQVDWKNGTAEFGIVLGGRRIGDRATEPMPRAPCCVSPFMSLASIGSS
jgi:RimJ/RimL family protein N-acetyltransferase